MTAASPAEKLPRGIQAWRTPEGVRVVRVHYSALSGRNPDTPEGRAWKEKALLGIVDGVESLLWRREQEIDFTVRDGKAIYQTFREATHVAKAPMTPIKAWPLLIGWDYGLTPAAHISQLTPNQHWNWLPCVVTEPGKSIGIKRFAETVMQYLAVTYPGYSLQHFGDPAGNAKTQTDERTCYELQFEDHGIVVEPGGLTWTERFNAIETALGRITGDGIAFLQIDPRERFVIDAMKGGYCKKRVANTDLYMDEPDKNEYSHVMNAAEYVASRLNLVRRSNTATRQRTDTTDLAESYAT